jgi:predicted DsbA family dithiol-disulfide isomerase
MLDARPRLYFDYVDPGSYLMDLRVERITAGADPSVERVPFELRPPPEPLLDPTRDAWVEYWRAMAALLRAEGREVRPPGLVPWTRKAHELVLQAGEKDAGRELHRALFRRFHEEGDDIGRVDVLMELATAAGLELTATKAVLDVDRHAGTVAELRARATDAGVRGVPTLVVGERILEGIHDDDAIRAFLGRDR